MHTQGCRLRSSPEALRVSVGYRASSGGEWCDLAASEQAMLLCPLRPQYSQGRSASLDQGWHVTGAIVIDIETSAVCLPRFDRFLRCRCDVTAGGDCALCFSVRAGCLGRAHTQRDL